MPYTCHYICKQKGRLKIKHVLTGVPMEMKGP